MLSLNPVSCFVDLNSFSYSLWFIKRQYKNLKIKPLNGLIPSVLECTSMVLAFVVTATSSVSYILQISKVS